MPGNGYDEVIKGIAAENPLYYDSMPYTAELDAWFTLGVDQATSLTNKIAGGLNAVTVGTQDSMAYQPGYATFGGNSSNNRFDTQMPINGSLDWTLMAMFRGTSAAADMTLQANQRLIGGVYKTATVALCIIQDGCYAYDGAGYNRSYAGCPPPPSAGFIVVALTYDHATRTLQPYSLKDGALITARSAVLAADLVETADHLYIGGSGNLGANNPVVDIRQWAAKKGKLTADQIAAIGKFWRTDAIAAGLTAY